MGPLFQGLLGLIRGPSPASCMNCLGRRGQLPRAVLLGSIESIGGLGFHGASPLRGLWRDSRGLRWLRYDVRRLLEAAYEFAGANKLEHGTCSEARAPFGSCSRYMLILAARASFRLDSTHSGVYSWRTTKRNPNYELRNVPQKEHDSIPQAGRVSCGFSSMSCHNC